MGEQNDGDMLDEEIYNLFNINNQLNMKDSIDILSFKKLNVKTNPKLVGSEYKYTLAKIYINNQPFLDIVKQYEEDYYEYNYNIASSMYEELSGLSTHHDCKHYLKGIDAVILTCGVCYHDCDYPLIVRTKETENEVLWFNYYNCRAAVSGCLPVFRFKKEQYKAALAQLKDIANDNGDND